MPIKDSTSFNFNGTSSTSMGVTNVTMSSGLYEEMYTAPREVKQVRVRGRDKPYNLGVDYTDNLIFKLTLAINDDYTSDTLRNISRWLKTDNFVPLYFEDTSKIYYAIMDGESEFVHNGLQGYINVTMLTDSPYSYTIASTPTYTSATPTFTINNTGDVTIKPILEITKTVGTGNVTITNVTNNNQAFTFTNLALNEVVYIDCENEVILTNLSQTYRYSAFSGDYLELLRSENTITITGNCSIQFKLQFKILQS